MKKRITAAQRAKIVEQLMKLTYSSLESHLQATYLPAKHLGKLDGKHRFQKKCVKDYAWMMFLISQLY